MRDFLTTISGFLIEVRSWVTTAFGLAVADDPRERNHRFFEEAIELVQSCDMSEEEAHALVRYVFTRPKGERPQEVAGTLITLMALAAAHGIEVQEAATAELQRCWDKIDKIREKQKSKPRIGEVNPLYPDRQAA